MEAEGT